MTTPAKLNELTAAEEPTPEHLERLGHEYVPRKVSTAERESRSVRGPEATGDRHGQA